MKTLRKVLSIVLLAVFGLPFVTPLFASTATSESNLPACCRRNGKHHCMMSMAERSQFASKRPEFRAPQEKCPYCPASVFISHHSDPGLAPAAAVYASVMSRPTVQAQTESNWRIARDRSRNKRGPPSLFLL